MAFIPETLPRLVIAKAAAKADQVDPEEAAILRSKVNVLQEFKFVTTMTFKIMFTEPIVLLLGIYNGFAYGILFLYLDGVYDVFAVNNGLSYVFLLPSLAWIQRVGRKLGKVANNITARFRLISHSSTSLWVFWSCSALCQSKPISVRTLLLNPTISISAFPPPQISLYPQS